MTAVDRSEPEIGTTGPAVAPVNSSVKATFTPKRGKRPKRDVETMDYLGAAKRFIRAAGRRVADCDEIELAELIALHQIVDQAIDDAVAGQKTRKSWAGIAAATGTSREAAYQRWGKK